MHRTRHSSLDHRGGSASRQDEWSAFLSTNMRALSTADSDASPPPPTRRRPLTPGDVALGRRVAKPRGTSTNETPSPPPDAWRPLGRRRASSPTNQRETRQAHTIGGIPSCGRSSSLVESTDTTDLTLRRAASFRGSSSCDASSVDEERQEGGLQGVEKEAMLSQLPRPPRSISVDSGARVKSPVLGNRNDAQTWQLLQDEEFFMTSPRFGTPLGNRNRGHVDSARDISSGSLLAAEPGNQYDDEHQGHAKLTKDSRASSVDFTLVRSHEVSPPLPPPQEPLQRSRARSFSYSAACGTSGHSPYNKQQYGPPFPHQPHLSQQAMAREFPPTLRCFHSGSSIMQSGQPQPPPSGVRPPRVSIPTDSPMHQYQYGPPMPYRRYSDAFAMPPYPDSYTGEQQENQSPQGNMGRGMRSYSMEYGNYPSTREARSQSMEGSQFFPSAPPMEYPPSLSRSNSADVVFDWSHGHMDLAPPLPPDTRPVSGAAHFPPPPPEAYYYVEFKRGRREVFAGRAAYKAGEYVKVEADRGEDIGRIVQRTTDVSKDSFGNESGSPGEESTGRSKRHDLPKKKIICVASKREFELLNDQRKEEHEVFEVCKTKVRQRLLPMNVIDAEYQFDRHKLTFFFEADRRIDFRELVRDLFAIYKTRIWLQQVISSRKKMGSDPEAN